MTRENALIMKCDQCGKEERLSGDIPWEPVGWYTVSHRREAGKVEAVYDFCCLECLNRWTNEYPEKK